MSPFLLVAKLKLPIPGVRLKERQHQATNAPLIPARSRSIARTGVRLTSLYDNPAVPSPASTLTVITASPALHFGASGQFCLYAIFSSAGIPRRSRSSLKLFRTVAASNA
jgi:hypothetical protein